MSENSVKKARVTYDAPETRRLDRFMAETFPAQSRTFFKFMIRERRVLVDGHPVSAHHPLRPGQVVTIDWPVADPDASALKPGPLPFAILHEDDAIVVIDKPAGLLVHPTGSRTAQITLIDYLKPRLRTANWPSSVRPGLVHRLDRDTSGVLVFAKSPEVHAAISRQFASRKVKKTYRAIAHGRLPSDQGEFECRLARDPRHRMRFVVAGAGRTAVTRFEVSERFGDLATDVTLHPLTGRTHQLRVQLAAYGHPIVGDVLYRKGTEPVFPVSRHLLHAARLQFQHPGTEESVAFESPIPDDFSTEVKRLRALALQM